MPLVNYSRDQKVLTKGDAVTTPSPYLASQRHELVEQEHSNLGWSPEVPLQYPLFREPAPKLASLCITAQLAACGPPPSLSLLTKDLVLFCVKPTELLKIKKPLKWEKYRKHKACFCSSYLTHIMQVKCKHSGLMATCRHSEINPSYWPSWVSTAQTLAPARSEFWIPKQEEAKFFPCQTFLMFRNFMTENLVKTVTFFRII